MPALPVCRRPAAARGLSECCGWCCRTQPRSNYPARKPPKQSDAKMKTTQTRMPFANPRTDVPKGQSKIAQRFNAEEPAAPGHVPKGRLKDGDGSHVQSSLRDSNGIGGVPGVETP